MKDHTRRSWLTPDIATTTTEPARFANNGVVTLRRLLRRLRLLARRARDGLTAAASAAAESRVATAAASGVSAAPASEFDWYKKNNNCDTFSRIRLVSHFLAVVFLSSACVGATHVAYRHFWRAGICWTVLGVKTGYRVPVSFVLYSSHGQHKIGKKDFNSKITTINLGEYSRGTLQVVAKLSTVWTLFWTIGISYSGPNSGTPDK